MKDNENFADLLRQFEREQVGSARRDPQVGDKVRGTLVSIGADQVFVDFGGKSEGVMDRVGLVDANGELGVSVGDTIATLVTAIDEETGTVLLGSQPGRHLRGGAELEHAVQNQLPVEGQVTGVVKGGVEVQIAGQRGFCPASQLDLGFVEDMASFVGQRHAFRITRYEGGRHVNLVVSRRALLEEEQQARVAQTRARIEVGAVLPGTVTALQDYGAFVDLGGVEGMVHISELGFGHVKHPSEVLATGQRVEVAVLRIDKTDNPRHPEKIALSIRALARDPWQDADRRFPVGARVKGKVTRLQPFGVFVELEPGIEGLIHISELGAGRRIGHPHEVLSAGDPVEARVLGVDMEKRRIGLSLDTASRTEAAAEAKAPADYAMPRGGFGTLGDLLREGMRKKK